MIFDEKAKYSSETLLNKRSCNGRTIRVESLDVATAERINKRVSRSAKQHHAEAQKAMEIAKKTYSD